MSEYSQSVASGVWTQTVSDPELWAYQNSGAVLVLTYDSEGGAWAVTSPECWRFARGFRTGDSHGWVAAPDLVPPFPPPIPDPGPTA